MNYTPEQIEKWKIKADKWDELNNKISTCFINSDGDYDEENPDGSDLTTIGEMAAIAFGWL